MEGRDRLDERRREAEEKKRREGGREGEDRPLTYAADKPAREPAAGGEEPRLWTEGDTANPISGRYFVLQLPVDRGV